MTDIQIASRLVTAALLGGFIGLERQVQRHSAGLRTHILVCLGSCLIMLTSLYVFDIYSGRVNIDPGRIAAGVVTGIGFLGAGAVIREGEGVRGLTTAASIWVVAGIGLAVGCGFYSAGIFATGIVLLVLLILRRIENIIFPDLAKKRQA